MSEGKYTPGPWHWTREHKARDMSRTWSLIGEGGYGILSCDGIENSPQSCNPADAALIARAPDLLAENERLRAELVQTEERNDNLLGKLHEAETQRDALREAVQDFISTTRGRPECCASPEWLLEQARAALPGTEGK